MPEYSIKRIDASSLKDIRYLYWEVHKIKEPINFFRKKFDTSFTGVSNIGFVAYDKNNLPAAFYGIFPCFIEYHGARILAAQSGDTMTHPAHQGKGLFTTLAKMTYELAKENEIQFVYGFPNKNSYPGFIKKLNWVHKENIKAYAIKIKTIPLAKIAKKINLLKPLYTTYCQSVLFFFKSDKSHFDNSIIDDELGGVQRSTDFFKYKEYSPKFIIRLHNKCIWLKIDGRLWLGDVEKCAEKDFQIILKKLKKISFLLGVDIMVFHTSPDTNIDRLLSGMNYPFIEYPIGFVNFNSNIDISKIKYTGADFDTF
jgi:hypothetical protein